MNYSRKAGWILVLPTFVSSYYIAMYLRVGAAPLVRMVVFFLILLAGGIIVPVREDRPGKGGERSREGLTELFHKKSALILTGIFSALFTLCILLGYHIHIESAYSGLMDKNYITPYTGQDLLAAVFIFPGIWTLSYGLVRKTVCGKAGSRNLAAGKQRSSSTEVTSRGQVSGRRSIIISAAAMVAAWVPYLLIYWPGFLFADTLASVQQAIGMNGLDNHHPVLYTLFLRFCLFLGRTLGGGNTLGCAIYCIIQMVFLGFAFSIMIGKVHERSGLPRVWRIILWTVFALTPYLATYSIAIWKDPAFSAVLMLLTLKLYELTDEKTKKGTAWWFGTGLLIFLTIFLRNNGIYIILFVDAAVLLLLLLGRRRVAAARSGAMALLTSVLLLGSWIVTGPVYRSLGIVSPKVESYGVFFNQMARVAAGGGQMSEEDKAYMDAVLELDLYPETYRPCCIDQLKWNQNFHSEVLEHDFFKHWFSMLVKNPRIYFEAWELETCGFWTVNVKAVNQYARNIGGGSPRNFSEDFKPLLESMDLHPANLLGADFWRDLFQFNEWGIPVGMIAWGILLLAVCILVRGDLVSLLSLTPSAGLLITLIIASPIWYWPRYGAAVQFLIPFYLLLFRRRDPV